MPGSDFDKRIYSYVVNTINELKKSGRLPEGKNLNAAGITAQIILETGHGKSKLSQEAHNYGGIKADSSWKGDTYTATDGNVYRKYESSEQGLADQLSFYLDNPRYDNAGALDATNASDWAKAIKKAGYAEDPDYVKKLNSISRKFEDPTYQETESSVEPVNTDSTNSQYKPLEKVNVGTVDNYQLPNIDYSVTGENTKVDNTIPYKPMTTPTVNTSFTGQGSLFKLGGNLFPDGGTSGDVVYTYDKRPGVRYKKTEFGWLINVPGETEGYIPIKDPDGSRTKELNNNAKPAQEEDYKQREYNENIRRTNSTSSSDLEPIKLSNNEALGDMLNVPQTAIMAGLTGNKYMTPSEYLQGENITQNKILHATADILLDPMNVFIPRTLKTGIPKYPNKINISKAQTILPGQSLPKTYNALTRPLSVLDMINKPNVLTLMMNNFKQGGSLFPDGGKVNVNNIKPYKPKSLEDYQYHKKKYTDSLSAYNENKNIGPVWEKKDLAYFNDKYYNNKAVVNRQLLNKNDKLFYPTSYEKNSAKEISAWENKMFGVKPHNIGRSTLILNGKPTDKVVEYPVYKKPVQPVEEYRIPTVDSLPMRPISNTTKAGLQGERPDSTPIWKTLKPLDTSGRQQTVLTWNPETKRHDKQIRVQDDAFVNDEGWVDNSQPVVYYNPETEEYNNKPFVFEAEGSEKTYNFKQGGTMNRYYATGGPMEGMPSDGQAGQLTSFDAGGSHEENGLGGIPQGMNPNGQQNLVEEGETKLNAKNYIFSDSLKVDKDTAKEFYFPSKYVGKTFAEVSKLMERPDSRRKHDSIEENAKKKDLEALMSAQEEFKAKDLQRDMENMMVKHPDFMQSMMAQQAPQMPEQAPVDPMMAQDPMMQQGIPMEAPMAKMGGYQNQMNSGGFMNKVGQVGKNYGLALADTALGVVGADNVIKDSDYTGAGSEFAKGAQKFTGAVGKIAAPIAANILLPGVGGALVGGAQNAMGGIGGENTTIQNGRIMTTGGDLDFIGLGTEDEQLASVSQWGDPREIKSVSSGLNMKTIPELFKTNLSQYKNLQGDKTPVDLSNSNTTDNQGAPEAQSYDQSLANAIGTYAPVAYNIGQGLFGKVDKLNADDYINKATIENYRENINPQLRASDEAFAGAKKGLRNAGAGSGAYMANLQAMHSQDQAQKAGIYANAENQYATRQLQIDQANAARGDQQAAMRLQIHDYNMRGKAAKDRMLQEGLSQVGKISQSNTSNDLATMYNNLYAPDFKDFASYNSYADMLKQKAQAKKKK